MSKASKLPTGWTSLPLGDLLTLEYGKSFPQTRRKPGPHGVYGSNGVIDRADKYLIEEPTVIVGRKGSAGEVNRSEPKCWPIDTTYYVQLKNRHLQSLDFAYYVLLWLDPRRFIETTTKPGLNRDRVYEQRVPVPPLPVQGLIVSILLKAEEICCKREAALGMADKLLPAMYRDVFGEPRSNPNGWPVERLGEYLVDTRYGTSERTSQHVKGDPVLRIPNVVNRTIDTTDLKYLKVSTRDRENLRLEKHDILVVRTNGNKDYVGRAAVFDCDEEYFFASYLIRLRLALDKLNPHYVVAFLATSFGRSEIDANSRTSAGQYNISATGLRAIRIPVPPLSRQLKFLSQYEQWKLAKTALERGLKDARGSLSALMSKAFIGALTADFEEANSKAIQCERALEEQMPRLVALQVLLETPERAADAGILVTAMMKLLFLIQMKNSARRRFYQFVPYHYGPFAKELYADLEKLQRAGLIKIDNGDEDKMRIVLADPARTAELTAQLPDELREDIQAVLDEYGGLGHKELLNRVYAEYPAFAVKSRLRKGRAKGAKSRASKRTRG